MTSLVSPNGAVRMNWVPKDGALTDVEIART